MISSFLKDVVVVHMGVYIEQFGYRETIKKLLLRSYYRLTLLSLDTEVQNVYFLSVFRVCT